MVVTAVWVSAERSASGRDKSKSGQDARSLVKPTALSQRGAAGLRSDVRPRVCRFVLFEGAGVCWRPSSSWRGGDGGFVGSRGASPQPLSPGGVVSRRAFCRRCRSARGGQGQLLAGPSGVWHGLDLCLSLQALAPFPRQEFRNLLLEAESNLELKHRNR